jgi:ABC-type multidrug transport system ATPase subunit
VTSSLNNPAVALDEVSKLYGRFAALRMITGEFAAGRLYLILGENGAGKSTLLRVLAGLIHPSRGKLTILGSPDHKTVKSQLGYMAHASMLYDELSGRENLAYFAELYGIRDHAICDQAMQTVGLDPSLERRVGQYSQGMRQRLSLARAILNDPRILLLDEPFSNVDISSAREMTRLLGAMRDSGKTIFLVTHQPALLEGVADDSVYMSGGRVIERVDHRSSSLEANR